MYNYTINVTFSKPLDMFPTNTLVSSYKRFAAIICIFANVWLNLCYFDFPYNIFTMMI